MAEIDFIIQSGLLDKSRNNYKMLENYIKKLQVHQANIVSAWTSSGNDRYYIIKSLNDIGKELVKIYKGYYSFTGAASKYVGILKAFEKVTGSIPIPGISFSYKEIKVNKTSSKKIKINTTTVKSEAQKIAKLAQDIGELTLGYKNIASRIDDVVNNYLRGRTSSLRDLNKRLDNAAIKLVKTASVLVSICNKYDKTEENIRKKAEELKNGRDVTYVDGTISSVTVLGEGGQSKVYNYENRKYSIKIETGGLASINVTGKPEIVKWIKNRDESLSNKRDYYKQNHCTDFTKDKLKLLGIDYTGGGNGKVYYQNIKNNKWSGKNYDVECVDGKNALEEIINKSDGQPVYNIVLSFVHSSTWNNAPANYEWGHTLLIDKVEDGQVYFSDNWFGDRNYTEQPWKLDKFLKWYNTYYGGMTGAAHFISK
ncbi:MAG: hypothetical protein NC240_09175 [Clostridium sp.]|nr:hypothetical protein [Clostridium sp.]